ncbi:MAG TPA: hypothetical protein VIV11_05970 [Kofleriaceae bacterium]
MSRLPALLLVFAASGCAQLFGIDETSGPNVDPARVSVTMARWSIGASMSKNPLDLSMESGDFLLDDGAGGFMKLPAEHTANDTLSALLPDGTPPVLFSLPDVPTKFKRLWAMPARDRRGVFAVFEHPSPEMPLPSSSIMLMATLPTMFASNETFRIEAIGAWMSRGLAGAELPAPDVGNTTINATLPYTSFTRMTGSPAARISSADVVVVERYVGNQLTGVYQAPPFDQVDGPSPINANLVAVPANRPLTAMATPLTYEQRYSAVRPSVSGLGQSWFLSAAPGWSIGSTAGPRLHAGGIASMSPQPATAMISTMFGNPFESLDWRSLFQFVTGASRSYMFMGMAVSLTAQMYTVAEPTGTLTLDMPAGLPINIRANQVPLSTDGMMVTLDLNKPIEIDAITDKPAATLYLITLYELALSMDGMAVEKRPIADAITTGEPKLKFPPELFEADKYYFIDFRCMQGGYTNAATGDMQTLALPYSVSRADSAVFQVVAL